MTKKLDQAFISDATIRNASMKIIGQAFEGTPLENDSVSVEEYEWVIDQDLVDELAEFVPPQSLAEWKKATDAGFFLPEEKRYRRWIVHMKPGLMEILKTPPMLKIC